MWRTTEKKHIKSCWWLYDLTQETGNDNELKRIRNDGMAMYNQKRQLKCKMNATAKLKKRWERSGMTNNEITRIRVIFISDLWIRVSLSLAHE